MRISVSMIVKNEESCLEKCLNSVKDADEIVIVDTGSDPDDKTIEIAKKFTDKVYFGEEYRWRDDFSFSRNQALSKCTGDYILSIDADEVLEEGGISKIKEYINKTKADHFHVKIIYQGLEQTNTKVFKNNIGITWCGRIHNYLSVSGGPLSDIKIYAGISKAHLKDPDRALRILTEVVKENPNSVREVYYLAREYWYRKDYKTAAEWYEVYLKKGKWYPEVADARLALARCYFYLQQGDKARENCFSAIKLNPDFKEALLFMADLYYEPWKSKWRNIAESATNKDVLFVRAPAENNEPQVHCSQGVIFYRNKIPLKTYSNTQDPCLFNGFYFDRDYEVFKKHAGKRICFWNGSDVSRTIRDTNRVKIIKSKEATHYCHNEQLKNELASVGINAVVTPIFFGYKNNYSICYKPSTNPKVFMCAHPQREAEYGIDKALKLSKLYPEVEFHIYGIEGSSDKNIIYHGKVSEDQMDQEIKEYQGCLRFNKHDGVSQIVLKTYLMGLYPIVTSDFNEASVQLKKLCNEKNPNITDLSWFYDSSWFLSLFGPEIL